MRKLRQKKPGTGYWQEREWRRRSRARRFRQTIPFIVVGLLIGALAGNYIYDRQSGGFGRAELSELWDRYKPSLVVGRDDGGIPNGWENHYRRPAPSGTALRDLAVPQPDVSTVRYSVCVSSIRVNCVVDGDTIWHHGVKIRIADIDTPEISSPRCASEKARGERAKYRLVELLNAGPFHLVRYGDRDADRYGRKLRVIERDGQSLGMILISEGLARRWDGARRPWC